MGGALAGAALAGGTCDDDPSPPVPYTTNIRGLGVDIHCHFFNAADLPVSSFVIGVHLRSFFERHPWLGSIVEPLVHAVGNLLRGATPTDRDELAFLGGAIERTAPLRIYDRGMAQFIADVLRPAPPEGPRLWTPRYPEGLEPDRQRLRAEFASNLLVPETTAVKRLADGNPEVERRPLALFSISPTIRLIANTVAWARQLCDFRTSIIERYFELFGPSRLGMQIATPALVDFARWLPTPTLGLAVDAPRVSMDDQVRLAEQLMRRRPGIHPFVGIDPLREWTETKELLDRCFNQDGRGTQGNGFAGIKLYPPLGFSASGNAHLQGSYSGVATKVDGNLPKIFQYCADHDVSVMAHASDTNETQVSNNGMTALPATWLPIVRDPRYRKLRINLAHMAGLSSFVHGRDPEIRQGLIGTMMDEEGGARVFTDVSCEEKVSDSAFRNGFLRALKLFTDEHPARKQRIMFGTDWIMLGFFEGYPSYLNDWFATIRRGTKPDGFLDPVDVDDFFGRNAFRFLGFDVDGPCRTRLRAFYDHNYGASRPRWVDRGIA